MLSAPAVGTLYRHATPLHMKENLPPATNFTEGDLKLISCIAASAQKPRWEHAITAASVLLLCFGIATLFYSLPYVFKSRSLRLCERHDSIWIPVAPTPDHDYLERLFFCTGGVFAFIGLAGAGTILINS